LLKKLLGPPEKSVVILYLRNFSFFLSLTIFRIIESFFTEAKICFSELEIRPRKISCKDYIL
jgi:hypothetical protein